jgi:hypothetical protein
MDVHTLLMVLGFGMLAGMVGATGMLFFLADRRDDAHLRAPREGCKCTCCQQHRGEL